MKEEEFKSIKADYHDLLFAVKELMEEFKDYTPDQKEHLERVIADGCESASDLPKGQEIVRIIGSYIEHRYVELEEFRMRREKSEEDFMNALPGLFDKLAVESENSCDEIAKSIEEFSKQNNYQLLVGIIIRTLASI